MMVIYIYRNNEEHIVIAKHCERLIENIFRIFFFFQMKWKFLCSFREILLLYAQREFHNAHSSHDRNNCKCNKQKKNRSIFILKFKLFNCYIRFVRTISDIVKKRTKKNRLTLLFYYLFLSIDIYNYEINTNSFAYIHYLY